MQQRRYPGVTPFTSDQKNIFFGRDEDINKLIKYISLRDQVLLYSKSGVGKTSLLNAGILPNLAEKYSVIKIRFNAYDDKKVSPIAKITALFKNTFPELENKTTVLDNVVENEKDKSLWYHFKKVQLIKGETKKFLVVFDQFEELFSYPDEQVSQLKEQLQELINDNLPNLVKEYISEQTANDDLDEQTEEELDCLYDEMKVKTVFVIRADRLNLLNKLTDKLPNIQKNYYELLPLTKEQAKQSIIMPAISDNSFESPKFDFSKEAVDKIIDTLSNNVNRNIETTQLQIVCQRVEENILAESHHEKKGIVNSSDLPPFNDIFFDFYERSVSNAVESLKLTSDFEKNKQIKEIHKFIEDHLIRNRQRISLDINICLSFVSREVLTALGNTYLLRSEQNTVGTFSYELSHDTLVGPILDSRKTRILKEEEEDLLKKKDKELAKERIKAATEKAKREREKKNQRKIILIISIALIFSTSFGIWGGVNARKANTARVQAEKKEKRLKELTIKYHIKEAYSYYQDDEYEVALGKYIYLRDELLGGETTNAIEKRIKKCENMIVNSPVFDSLMNIANQKAEELNFTEAFSYYKKSYDLDIDNVLVNEKLLKLNSDIGNKVYELEKQATAINFKEQLSSKLRQQANSLKHLNDSIKELTNNKNKSTNETD